MSANWWEMQKYMEQRQADIFRFAEERRLLRESGIRPATVRMAASFPAVLRRRLGSLLLRWGRGLCESCTDDLGNGSFSQA
jgi:hypothetical protein